MNIVRNKKAAALTTVILVIGGLATGCTGEAGSQGSQLTEAAPNEPSAASGTSSIGYTPNSGNTVSLSPSINVPPATSANTQTSTETCDGDPKPAIPGKPDPNDNSRVMQYALESARPNPITSRANLSFIAICLPGGTPPWDLRITDGVNQSPSLSWKTWNPDTGNTTYGQNS